MMLVKMNLPMRKIMNVLPSTMKKGPLVFNYRQRQNKALRPTVEVEQLSATNMGGGAYITKMYLHHQDGWDANQTQLSKG